ncbi:MAG: ABC transporter permease subunit [Pseudopelagicola sp.]|nr:ABC transporter permease subunit [Pseudopelagicola sp.]
MAPILALDGVKRFGPPMLGLGLFLATWQAGHVAYGAFILPSPVQTLQAAFGVLTTSEGWIVLGATVARVVAALAISLLIGGFFGLLAGYSNFGRAMFAPVATILLGIPATAWVILTMIWFGPSHGAILFTISVVTGPMLYIGMVDAVLTRDRRLEEMAAAFGASRWAQFSRVALRQIIATLAPVFGIALALGFKVAIMSELVSNVAGIGAALARSRAHMDIDMALAYVVLAVMGLLVIEHGLIRPMQRRVGAWKRVSG